jgi:hypothetical protein
MIKRTRLPSRFSRMPMARGRIGRRQPWWGGEAEVEGAAHGLELRVLTAYVVLMRISCMSPTRSPRKSLQYNTLSSSLFATAGLTRAFGGQRSLYARQSNSGATATVFHRAGARFCKRLRFPQNPHSEKAHPDRGKNPASGD